MIEAAASFLKASDSNSILLSCRLCLKAFDIFSLTMYLQNYLQFDYKMIVVSANYFDVVKDFLICFANNEYRDSFSENSSSLLTAFLISAIDLNMKGSNCEDLNICFLMLLNNFVEKKLCSHSHLLYQNACLHWSQKTLRFVSGIKSKICTNKGLAPLIELNNSQNVEPVIQRNNKYTPQGDFHADCVIVDAPTLTHFAEPADHEKWADATFFVTKVDIDFPITKSSI